MCSDPQEIFNKGTCELHTVACRKCDECIATRRHGWVSRAMAEKAMWPHALVLTLTYSEDTEESRDGARMFCYADVSAFLKRLRRAADYLSPGARVRFLCAGEQGDRNGRCHWHLIVYSDVDLTALGKFRRSGYFVSHRRDLVSVGKTKRRLNWSLWPHGFVLVQEPDQGGMNYVLSYCLKDQFSVERSRGTAREAKVENFATGLFRMSKAPAIGEDFLMRKLEALAEAGAVLPSLRIKVPEMRGYWHPSGVLREKLLWALVAINQRVRWQTGGDAPQWSGLVASCSESEADMEILNGVKAPVWETQTNLQFTDKPAFGEVRQRATIRKRCGSTLPCNACLDALDGSALARLGLEAVTGSDGRRTYTTGGPRGIEEVGRCQAEAGQGINAFCRRAGSREVQVAFGRRFG